MSAYGDYKAELARLCERGVIKKDTKRAFSQIKGESAFALSYAVARELLVFFEGQERKSGEYAALASATEKFLLKISDELIGLRLDIARVIAYIRLTVSFNSGDGDADRLSDILKRRRRETEESLQNIRLGMKVFGGDI